MKHVHRFPVAVWEGRRGLFTAALVEDEGISAVGDTVEEALRGVRDHLSWLHREQPWREGPRLARPATSSVRVRVRPEHRVEERIFPSESTFTLRVVFFHGLQEDGLRACHLPFLGVRFFFHDAASLRPLVRHYVRKKLSGRDPGRLLDLLPPRGVRLEEVVVRVPEAPSQRLDPDLPALSAVAERMGGRSRAWRREAEVTDLVRRVEEGASVLVVGAAGSGKSAVVGEAARRLQRVRPEQGRSQRASGARRGRCWRTSAARLISGMRYLGQWQARLEEVVAELAGVRGVLCVESLLELVRVGGGAPGASLAAFLAPWLERGEVQVVAEATPEEVEACRRLLPGFADLFTHLVLPEMEPEVSVEVLRSAAQALEQVRPRGAPEARSGRPALPAGSPLVGTAAVEDGVPPLLDRLFRRFRPYDALPGPALRFLEEAVEAGRRTVPEVLARFSAETGLPEAVIRDDLPLEPEAVLAWFRGEILGQEAACRAVARVVVTLKAGLNDPQRPPGALLLCGPTGVGKTETARALARYLFGSEDRLIRLDMSEYSGPGAAARLLGQPSGEPSDLVRRVRRQPFCVLLLDEVEKADAEVFDVLLGVLDEGRLTDAWGRLTSFRSAVILMTSNLGAEAGRPAGLTERPPVSYEAEAMAFFRPEFFNRLDGVVRYGPLGEDVVRSLAVRELERVGRREGLARAGARLDWSEAVVDLLVREGVDARYGARPLQRCVERRVVAPLARLLVDRPGLRGGTVRLEVEEGEVKARIA